MAEEAGAGAHLAAVTPYLPLEEAEKIIFGARHYPPPRLRPGIVAVSPAHLLIPAPGHVLALSPTPAPLPRHVWPVAAAQEAPDHHLGVTALPLLRPLAEHGKGLQRRLRIVVESVRGRGQGHRLLEGLHCQIVTVVILTYEGDRNRGRLLREVQEPGQRRRDLRCQSVRGRGVAAEAVISCMYFLVPVNVIATALKRA